MARAQSGDEASLEALVERTYPRVRRWALVRLRDPTEADDLTQEVMLRMLRQIDSFDGASRFDTWLYAVTRNAATDRLRAFGRRRRAEVDPRVYEQLVPDQPGDPSRRAEQLQTRELLRVPLCLPATAECSGFLVLPT